MKTLKLFLFLFISVCSISVVVTSCKKEVSSDVTASEANNVDADGYTYEDDSNSFDNESEAVGLETRATDPFSITSLTSGANADIYQFDGCATHKFVGLARAQQATFTLKGKGFGKTKGNSKIECFWTKEPTNIYGVGIPSWSDTTIIFNISGGIKAGMKNFKMKVNLTNDSISKTVSKTIDCIGFDNQGNNYGSNKWELDKQRLLAGKEPTESDNYDTAAIDTTTTGTHYVPEVGDILEKSGGKQAVVVAVAAADSKGYRKIKVWQRNTLCTGALKKATWSYKLKFTPKSDEAAATTWTKFTH